MDAALTGGEAEFALKIGPAERERLRLRLVGARKAARGEGLDAQAGVTFYALQPSKLVNRVPHYSRVRYAEVYPGIDIVYYFQGDRIEYDFIVKPGSDPDRIRVAYEGARGMALTEAGELQLRTSGGDLKQLPPRGYQERDGKRIEVATRYELHGRSAGFAVDHFDRTRELVIDPVVVYASYYGGTGSDSVSKVAVDASAAVYVTGTTEPSNFLVTPGQIGITNQPITQNTLVTAAVQVPFVAKFAPNSGGGPLHLIWAALIGYAGGGAWGEHLAVDGAGGVYVGGRVGSNNIYGSECSVGWSFYVQKLKQSSQNGQPFLEVSGATCPTGGNFDNTTVSKMIAWPGGGVYLAGTTYNPNFPVLGGLPGIGAPTSSAGKGFVMRLDWNGSQIQKTWSTLFGGPNAAGSTSVRGMAVGPHGDVFIAGQTGEAGIPLVHPMMSQFPSHGGAAFLARLAQPKPADGLPLAVKYSTLFYSGTRSTVATAIAVDASGRAYMGGAVAEQYQNSPEACDFPRKGAVQLDCDGGSDGFLAIFPEPAAGQPLDTEAATLFGGDRHDSVIDVGIDNRGGVYLLGSTNSNQFAWRNPLPIQPSNLQNTFLARIQRPNGMWGLMIDYVTWLPVGNAFASMAAYAGSVYIGGQAIGTPPLINQWGGSVGGWNGYLMQIRDQMTITVTSQPAGRQVELMGGSCGHAGFRTTPFSAVVTPGGFCRFTAAQTDSTPDSQYEFFNWWDGSNEHQRGVTFGDAPTTYAAHYKARYRLISRVNPAAAGSISPSGETWHDSGSLVSHDVDPSACYIHLGWNAGVVDGVALMNGPREVIATMAANAAQQASGFAVTIGRPFVENGVLKVSVQIRNTTSLTRQLVSLALDGLPRGTTLLKASGLTQCALPAGSPYVDLGNFTPLESRTITLAFAGPAQTVAFTPRMLQGLKPR